MEKLIKQRAFYKNAKDAFYERAGRVVIYLTLTTLLVFATAVAPAHAYIWQPAQPPAYIWGQAQPDYPYTDYPYTDDADDPSYIWKPAQPPAVSDYPYTDYPYTDDADDPNIVR